jgi:hypothetical protein
LVVCRVFLCCRHGHFHLLGRHEERFELLSADFEQFGHAETL